MAKRTLWKVMQGYNDGNGTRPSTLVRPESKTKVYTIFVPNNIRAATSARIHGRQAFDFTEVWSDDRTGSGFRLYERIDHFPQDG